MHLEAWQPHSSPAGWNPLRVCSLFPIMHSQGICTGGTDSQTHTHSLKGPLRSNTQPNFSWVAAKIKAFIHPQRWGVKRGAGRLNWAGVGLPRWCGEWLCPVSLWLVFCSDLLGSLCEPVDGASVPSAMWETNASVKKKRNYVLINMLF